MRLGFLFLCGWQILTAAPKPVVVQDTALLRWFLQPELPDSLPLPDGPWTMVPASDSSLVLLRSSVEYKRFPVQVTRQLVASEPHLFEAQLTSRDETWRPALSVMQPDWSWTDEPMDRIDGIWFNRDEGLEIRRGLISGRADRWWNRDYWWFGIAKISGSFRGEVFLQVFNDYMNMQRDLREFYGSKNYSDYSWGGSVSWLGVTYSFQRAAWVLPEYFWLEPHPDSLFLKAYRDEEDSAGGKVLSLYENGITSGHTSNLVHSLELRLWHLRYQAIVDGDMYTGIVHRFAFEEVPTGWGFWGAMVVGCGGIWAPGFSLELGPYVNRQLPWIPHWNWLQWYPVRMEFYYRNSTHFHFALSTRFHLGEKK
ncbi:MAG TPA: hypothetical protein VLM37_12985 [Fibrobacteraceae bacterium]|nr:hypothetical protein [Fibrobacteraceae bacterium]